MACAALQDPHQPTAIEVQGCEEHGRESQNFRLFREIVTTQAQNIFIIFNVVVQSFSHVHALFTIQHCSKLSRSLHPHFLSTESRDCTVPLCTTQGHRIDLGSPLVSQEQVQSSFYVKKVVGY